MDYISGSSSLENIKLAFKHLVNLEIVEFRNITIDEYRPVPPDQPIIEASRVVQLKFTSPCSHLMLSSSEIILIDFLNKQVSLPTLTSIEVSNTSRSRSRWRQNPAPPHPDHQNETVLKYGIHSSLSGAIAQLLAKTAPTLRDLKLGRVSFELLRLNELNNETFQNLGKVELKNINFRVDVIGVDHLLAAQTKLESITCDDDDVEDPPEEDEFWDSHNFQGLCSAFGKCIANCCQTLWSVKISQLVPIDLNKINEWRIFDLAVFQNCYGLRYLSIDNSGLKESSFSSGHCLPASLTSLTIRVQRVINMELTAMTGRIQFLLSLRQLIVASLAEYEVSMACLQNILQATSAIGGNSGGLHDVELKNGKLSGDMSASQLQQLLCHADESGSRYWACEIRPKGILFEKWVTRDRN